MRQIFGIALWEIKLAIRHTSFWLALIVLSVFDFMSSNLLHHSGTISYTSWGLAIWLSHRFLYIYLMLGLITIVIMRREQAERYDELIHSLPYSRYRFLLGRYLAVIFVGCALIAPQHLATILLQCFVWKTPVRIATYLSFFLITHLPALLFYSAISILVAGLANRYQSVAITCTMVLWFILTYAPFATVHSQKLFGNLFDFRGQPMFTTMDPVLRWFPELKLVILNRLVYCFLALMILLFAFHLYRRRLEVKKPRVLLYLIPLAIAIVMSVYAYLTDWQAYLNTVQDVDIVLSAGRGFPDSVRSNVAADGSFDAVEYTLTVTIDESNRRMSVHSFVKVDDSEILPHELTFALDSAFDIVSVKNDQGIDLHYRREDDMLTILMENEAKSAALQIDYEGVVWQWAKSDTETLGGPIMQFVNTGWLSQYITRRAVWMEGITWYPQLQISGHECTADYYLSVLTKQDVVFISNAGRLLKTGIEQGMFRYESKIEDVSELILAAGPYTYYEDERFGIYYLDDNTPFVERLVWMLGDKIKFYETVTERHWDKPFVIIQGNGINQAYSYNPLVLANVDFSSFIGDSYPFQESGVESVDQKLAFIYLAHPLDGSIGLNSTALGIGSYIDSLYVKLLGFDTAYDRERQYRLELMEAEANEQYDKAKQLRYRMIQIHDPIQISKLSNVKESNLVWLELDRQYQNHGFDAVCEAVRALLSGPEFGGAQQ